jgi:Xaa-Pro aminopeptidase
MDIVKQKISQATGLLQELNIDAWLVFVRETMMMADPVMPLVVGHHAVWQSFFIYTRGGDAIAIVGNFDRELFTQGGRFTEVVCFTESARTAIREVIARLNLAAIAVNYSLDDPAADGLTHGMYMLLQEYLSGTPYSQRLVSAQELCAKLRSRKVPDEIDLIAKAAEAACDVWAVAIDSISPGMTEKQIAAVVDDCLIRRGGTNSFSTIVNAGDKTAPGHGMPSDAVLAPGDLLHVDFGVRLNDYCSDLQRLVYFRKPGELALPAELDRAFNTVHSIISETAKVSRPGALGWEIDAVARKMLVENGYPEYQHALGHQLGRDAHDGGAIIGPKWDRYGSTPFIALETGNAFTLELEIMLPGIGCVGLEEDVVISEQGARFLCPRQEKLMVR